MTPPQARRPRTSITPLGADDVSLLNLPEVRSRLERNSRVLSTSLFSPPLTPSGFPLTPSPDPARDKLLASREQLLARERELLQAQDEGESSSAGRRRSDTARSGKALAMATIQAGDAKLAQNGVML